MKQESEISNEPKTHRDPNRKKAVAYYRHSVLDRQEGLITIQRDQVRQWAEKQGMTIIKEFFDAGHSGLTVEYRPAFAEMIEDWVQQNKDFDYILCLDASRWGRFHDIDQYSEICKQHGKQVIYTSSCTHG